MSDKIVTLESIEKKKLNEIEVGYYPDDNDYILSLVGDNEELRKVLITRFLDKRYSYLPYRIPDIFIRNNIEYDLRNVEALEFIYDNFSTQYFNLDFHSYYRFVVNHKVLFNNFSNGLYLVEGLKSTDKYEIQKTMSYYSGESSFKEYRRTKYDGIWNKWKEFI